MCRALNKKLYVSTRAMPVGDAAKLTLRLSRRTIEAAKRYAREQGTSVSKLVENYFNVVAKEALPNDIVQEEEAAWMKSLSPITRSLLGVAKGSTLSEYDYKQYLVEKHQ